MLQNHKVEIIKIKTFFELNENLISSTNYGYFLFCISGEGTIFIDDFEIHLKANSVINLIANSNIVVPVKEQKTNIILVKYDQNVKEILSIHSLIIFCPFTGAIKIELEQSLFSELLFYIEKIDKELNSNKNNDLILLNLIIAVKELSRYVEQENTDRRISNKTILKFINLVDKNFQNNRSLDYYTEKLLITKKTLYRAFKENLGISPKEFINFKLSMEAKKMLLHTNLNIKEISSNLGFQSQYNFTNFFKKNNNNSSPSDYKSSMSQNHIILS